MKAAVIHEHGGLDCVKIEQVPEKLCWRFVRRR
jgi:hypothetical protein